MVSFHPEKNRSGRHSTEVRKEAIKYWGGRGSIEDNDGHQCRSFAGGSRPSATVFDHVRLRMDLTVQHICLNVPSMYGCQSHAAVLPYCLTVYRTQRRDNAIRHPRIISIDETRKGQKNQTLLKRQKTFLPLIHRKFGENFEEAFFVSYSCSVFSCREKLVETNIRPSP